MSEFENKLNVSCEEVQIVSTYSFTQSLLPKKLSARDMYVNTQTHIYVSSSVLCSIFI